jgi:MFS transporter, OFA family, oxalate/formate antiporter
MSDVKLFGMPAEKGRWILIPLGMLVFLCMGTVYSWSIFRKPLENLLNIGATESLLPFTFLLVLFAVLMPITGFYIDRIGSRKVIAIGGVVMGLGYILSSLGTNISMLVFTYGIIAGIGVGITYGVPLAVSAKWFPDKKGLAVGLTIIGFGLSPVITAPLAQNLIHAYGVQFTFVILGIAFTAIILAVSTTLKTPPAGWRPAGWNPPVTARTDELAQNKPMIQTSRFYGLWLCYTIGGFVGLTAIGISSPLAQEIIKLDEATAATTVALFALFNGAGRPFFGWLTDRIKPRMAAVVSYVLIIIASIMMLNAGEGDVATYLVAFSLFYFCLGGWLAIAPTSTLTLFRPEDYAKNYGIVFTAYGAGALIGTLLAGRIRDLLGSYTAFFIPTAVLAALGIVLAIFMLKRTHRPIAVTEPELSQRN